MLVRVLKSSLTRGRISGLDCLESGIHSPDAAHQSTRGLVTTREADQVVHAQQGP